jgi:hypothetical protein
MKRPLASSKIRHERGYHAIVKNGHIDTTVGIKGICVHNPVYVGIDL